MAAKPPPAKRARKSAPAAEEDDDFVPNEPEKPVAAPSKADGKKAAAAEKALEKKHKMRVKKIFDQCVLIVLLPPVELSLIGMHN